MAAAVVAVVMVAVVVRASFGRLVALRWVVDLVGVRKVDWCWW